MEMITIALKNLTKESQGGALHYLMLNRGRTMETESLIIREKKKWTGPLLNLVNTYIK